MELDQEFLATWDAYIKALSEGTFDELDGKSTPKEPPRYQWILGGMGQPYQMEGVILYPFSEEEDQSNGIQHLRGSKKGMHKRKRIRP